jgi:hypothetical protein
MRLTALKKICSRGHWEKTLPHVSNKKNIDYCSKGDNFITNTKIEIPVEVITDLYP